MRTLLVAAAVVLGGCTVEHAQKPPAPEPAPVYPTTCSPGQTYDIRLSPGLSPTWHDAAEAAVARWSLTLGPTFPHVVRTSDEIGDLPRGCVVSVWPGGEDPGAWASTDRYPKQYGTRPDNATIYVDDTDPRLTPVGAYAVLLHEFGHVLGLDHDNDRVDLTAMNAYVAVPGRVGCVDAVKLCQTWGCDPGCAGNEWLPGQ